MDAMNLFDFNTGNEHIQSIDY